jgi:hypothetical protein
MQVGMDKYRRNTRMPTSCCSSRTVQTPTVLRQHLQLLAAQAPGAAAYRKTRENRRSRRSAVAARAARRHAADGSPRGFQPNDRHALTDPRPLNVGGPRKGSVRQATRDLSHTLDHLERWLAAAR